MGRTESELTWNLDRLLGTQYKSSHHNLHVEFC